MMRLAYILPHGQSMGLRRGGNGVNREPWVVSAVVEGMIRSGMDTARIHIERLIAPGCKPDVIYVTPYMVLIYEAKSFPPNPACRKQVYRYIEAARERWPGRQVAGYLVWPKGDTWRPMDLRDVEVARA
jgi:hypothetical protein